MLKVANSVINASQIATPITFAGDVTLSTGNLVIGTSGKGIDFSATPDTGTSELLADYEEGLWTPTLATTGTAFTSVTYTVQTGRYIKIGKTISYLFAMTTSAVTVGAASGDVIIGGLPFIEGGLETSSYLTASGWVTNIPSSTDKRGGQTQMRLKYRTLANGASANVAVADVSSTTNACNGVITIVLN
jgi:hypothetical protein